MECSQDGKMTLLTLNKLIAQKTLSIQTQYEKQETT